MVSASLILSWREGVKAVPDGDSALVVEGQGTRVLLRRVAPALRAALLQIKPPGESEDRLANLVQAEGNGSLSHWHYYLTRLSRRGLLCQSARVNGTPLATLVPVSDSFLATPRAIAPGCKYVLSRFAYLHRVGDETVLESPLAHARVVLNDFRAAALVGALTSAATAEEIARRTAIISMDEATALLSLLLRAGMLAEAKDDGRPGEDDDPALQAWEFHDLLFHARSRRGRCDAPYGATWRLAGRHEPPPALKPPPAGASRELARPDQARLEREDPPLARVMEQRRSLREFDAECPISDRQLGEFLFRVGRVKSCREQELATAAGPIRMEFASRPYPGGGGLYELEFYVAVNACANLDRGLYYYDAARHRLIQLAGQTEAVRGLLRDTAESAGISEDEVQVLLTLTTRFPRLAWKYESLAYALTLKHVGVVMQTMYLVATAMGLAPCAVGGGDSDLFAAAAGIDYYSETSVGEFLLGSRRHGSASAAR